MVNPVSKAECTTTRADAAVRPGVVCNERAATASFREVLAGTGSTQDMPAQTDVQTVAEGDTLSHMVLRHMRGQGLRPNLAELYARVDHVARENGLSNADRIAPGQVIRFGNAPPGATQSAAMAETAPPALAVQDVAPRPRQAALAISKAVDPARETPSRAPWRHILDSTARLSSPFGMRTHPITGRRQFHAGIDLAAPQGTTVRPLRPGVVTFSGKQGGYGNTVMVRHNDGIETLYAHLSSNLVKAGERVGADTQIGLVGSTGRSTGPHLHFEVRRDGHVFNPLPYLE